MQTSQIEENLAKTINCVGQSNLSFTEENLKLLISELSRSLQTLMEQSRVVIIKENIYCILYINCILCYIQRTAFFDKAFFGGFRWQTHLKATSEPCLQNCQQKASHLEISMMLSSWDSGSKSRWSPCYLKSHVNSCPASTHVASAVRPTGHCTFIMFPSADMW